MSDTVETKALWSLLHEARREKNVHAAFAANRAIFCAVRGYSRDAQAWESLASFELANPEKTVVVTAEDIEPKNLQGVLA